MNARRCALITRARRQRAEFTAGMRWGMLVGGCWAVLLSAVLFSLAGCGGSDDDTPATTQPVDCKAHPELCK